MKTRAKKCESIQKLVPKNVNYNKNSCQKRDYSKKLYFKGSLTEQFVFQQLVQKERLVIAYWASETLKAEIDFLVQHSNEVIPIEVKATENPHAKSLKSFCQKYHPETAIRTSLSDYRKETRLTNVPLYAIGNYL